MVFSYCNDIESFCFDVVNNCLLIVFKEGVFEGMELFKYMYGIYFFDFLSKIVKFDLIVIIVEKEIGCIIGNQGKVYFFKFLVIVIYFKIGNLYVLVLVGKVLIVIDFKDQCVLYV